MCHGTFGSDAWIKEEIARELIEEEREPGEETVEAADDGTPSFLNEERETDVEILTDGGE